MPWHPQSKVITIHQNTGRHLLLRYHGAGCRIGPLESLCSTKRGARGMLTRWRQEHGVPFRIEGADLIARHTSPNCCILVAFEDQDHKVFSVTFMEYDRELGGELQLRYPIYRTVICSSRRSAKAAVTRLRKSLGHPDSVIGTELLDN